MSDDVLSPSATDAGGTGSEPAATPGQVADAASATPASDAGEDLNALMSAAYDKLAAGDTTDADKAGADKTGSDADPAKTDPSSVADPSKKPDDQKPDKAASEQDKPGDPAAPAIVPEARVPHDAPVSWSADMKAKWSALPPDVQSYVANRDKEASQAISRLGTTLSAYKPIGEVLEQHRATFEKSQVHPAEVIGNLMAWNRLLETDAPAAIADLASKLGVDLASLVKPAAQSQANDDFALPPDPQVVALQNHIVAQDRRIAAFEAKLTGVDQQLTSRQTAEVDAQVRNAEASIGAFAKDKPDFAALLPDIEQELPRIQAANPQLSHTEILAQAYERARWANPTTRDKLVAEKVAAAAKEKADAEAKRIAAAKKAADEAKRAGAINVQSANANKPPATDEREAMSRRYDELMAQG